MASKTSSTVRLLLPLLVFLIAALAHSNHVWLQAHMAFRVGIDSPETVFRITGSVLWLAGAWLVSGVLNGLIVSAYVVRRTGAPTPRIVSNTVSAGVFLFAVFGIISVVFDRTITGLLATSGIVTLIIGFAIRDMIADFFSGLALNVEQPYTIGDWLELEPGVVGRVTELNWRATRLVTLSNRTIVVPNGNLAGRQFVNFSQPEPHFREALDIVLDFTTEPERAENILLAAVLATEGIVPDASHDVKIKGFSERGVEYEVRFWIESYADRARLRHTVARTILRHLTQAGISIPHGQQEIFIARSRRMRRDRRIDPQRLLARIGWLEALTEGELATLADVAISREVRAGERIVQQGETGDSMYVLVEGTLQARAATNGGTEEPVGIIEPGDAFGEMSVLTGAPRSATVTALTHAFALEVRRADLEPILRGRPEIADELGRVMATRVSSIRRAARAQDGMEAEDVTTRAGQIARRISVFFGLSQ